MSIICWVQSISCGLDWWTGSKGTLSSGEVTKGGGLDGNNSRKLLKKLDNLKLELPANLYPILKTLNLFKQIVDGCFSHNPCSDYKARINQFKESYKKLIAYCQKSLKVNLTVSWKVHCVTAHLEDVLTKEQKGLAMFAEQTGRGSTLQNEASHGKAWQVWGPQRPWSETADVCQ